MNQKITYRVWDKKENRFRHKNEALITPQGDIFSDYSGILENDRFIVQQCIGLKDVKYDKDIYEGDILKLGPSDGNPDIPVIIGEVVFNMNNALSILEWGLFTEGGYHSTDFLGEKEILGNIFENPELLK